MRIETPIKNMPPKMMEREKCKESLKRVSQGRASEREDRQKQIERDKVSGEKDRERERERAAAIATTSTAPTTATTTTTTSNGYKGLGYIYIFIYILPYNNNMAIDIMAPCDTEALHSTQKLHVIIAM